MGLNASVHRGVHLCLPFETDDEKHDAVVSFLREGLANGQRCQFIGTPAEFDDLGRRLEIEGLCAARAQARTGLAGRRWARLEAEPSGLVNLAIGSPTSTM